MQNIRGTCNIALLLRDQFDLAFKCNSRRSIPTGASETMKYYTNLRYPYYCLVTIPNKVRVISS